MTTRTSDQSKPFSIFLHSQIQTSELTGFNPSHHERPPSDSDDKSAEVLSSSVDTTSLRDSQLSSIVGSDAKQTDGQPKEEEYKGEISVVDSAISIHRSSVATESSSDESPYIDEEAVAENAALMIRLRADSMLSPVWPPGFEPQLWSMMRRDRLKGPTGHSESLTTVQQTMMSAEATQASKEKSIVRAGMENIGLAPELLEELNRRSAVLRHQRAAEIKKLKEEDKSDAPPPVAKIRKSTKGYRLGPRFAMNGPNSKDII